jgi:hypothetical protein
VETPEYLLYGSDKAAEINNRAARLHSPLLMLLLLSGTSFCCGKVYLLRWSSLDAHKMINAVETQTTAGKKNGANNGQLPAVMGELPSGGALKMYTCPGVWRPNSHGHFCA